MAMPEKRLFSVNIGKLDAEGIPDPRLRARTDQAAMAVFKLMTAAGLSGHLTMVHAVIDVLWVLHVDVDIALHEALQLFEQASPDPVVPEQAAHRITDNAASEIRKFMQAQQPANLIAVEQAALRVQSKANPDNPVISTLRQEPGQKMMLTTRGGALTLSLQAITGERLADDPIPVTCRIDKLGAESAILKLPKGERQDLPSSVGRDPTLVIPASLAGKEVLDAMFARYVSSKEFVTLQVREVIDRMSGEARRLQLEAWPK